MNTTTRTHPVRRAVRWGVALVVVMGLGVGAIAGYRVARDRLADEATNDDAPTESGTAVAQVTKLATTVDTTGTLGYTTAVDVDAPTAGTVLEIVEAGDTVVAGDVLARIDDRVVVWLPGDQPAWRTIDDEAEGDDVEQLERALVDLGFDPDGEVTVDDEYDRATAETVERWQESLGFEPTGVLEFGTIVFGGERDRVASVAADVGGQVTAGPLLALSSDERVATFAMDPADAVHLAVGDVVEVQLADGTVVESAVTVIEQGVEAWTITSAFGADLELPDRDAVAIDVEWERTIVDEVLVVPSSGLLRLDSGGYVVDVVEADGTLDRRAVTIGTSVGARVEVVAGLAPGDEIVVP